MKRKREVVEETSVKDKKNCFKIEPIKNGIKNGLIDCKSKRIPITPKHLPAAHLLVSKGRKIVLACISKQ